MNNFQVYKNGDLINFNHSHKISKIYDSEILFIFHGLFGRGRKGFKKNHSYSLMMNDVVELFN